MQSEDADIVIVGAGAAGLMAGIWAGRAAGSGSPPGRDRAKRPRIIIVDGAQSLGAKILVAGGGRCNVTHDVVDEHAYAGSSRMAIRKVLRRFDVPQTIEFFRELGVELKREETGKLFPTTDKARTVLDALLRAAKEAGVEIRYPWRVESIRVDSTLQKGPAGSVAVAPCSTFIVTGPSGTIRANRIILATGGKSLPKTGSDGHGYSIAQSLGHSIIAEGSTGSGAVFPALVPLTLPKNHALCGLSGISAVVTLEVRSGTGKKLHAFTDSMLCTHFGISGPAALDISRYFIAAKREERAKPPATADLRQAAEVQLVINWLPGETVESVDAALAKLGKISPGRWLRERGLPERLAKALCDEAAVDASSQAHLLTRDRRRSLANVVVQMPLPITGDRGFAHAEVTAGGVPLSELHLETMESRICPGLHLIGEICDVDGRIGGYNFQWAWASGFVAGNAATTSCSQ